MADGTIDALGVCIALRIPVVLWGAPGTGKSSLVQGIADQLGVPCEVVISSVREPSDFAGLPVVLDGQVSFAPPRWAQRLAAAGEGVLFLDELTTAPPAVQAALLRVVLDRVVGDLALPDAVAIVAAANPPEQASDGWDLSAPLANRFVHLDWRTSAASFASGLLADWSTPAPLGIPSDWRDGLPTARALVAAFVQSRPTLLCAVPTGADAGRAWPSPRTWSTLTELWAAASATVSEDVRALLVQGTIGTAAAMEFLTFVSEADLVDPEHALANPAEVTIPERADRVYAMLSAIVAAVLARNTAPRWEAAWEVLARVGGDRPDVAAMSAKLLVEHRPSKAQVPAVVASLAPVLQRAGLLAS